MKRSLESRVAALEKKMAACEKTLDCLKRLRHTQDAMTVKEAGRKGGQAKVPKGPATLPEARRREIARNAARARWAKEQR